MFSFSRHYGIYYKYYAKIRANSFINKWFSVFQLCLSDDKDEVEDIVIRCINCEKINRFIFKKFTFKEMIANFLLDAIFHHAGMSWIICSNEKLNMKLTKSIKPIGWIEVLGITHIFGQSCMEDCLVIYNTFKNRYISSHVFYCCTW